MATVEDPGQPTALERLRRLVAHRKTGEAVNDALVEAIIGAVADAAARPLQVAFGDAEIGAPGNRLLRDPRYAPVWALAHAALYMGATLPRREADETEAAWIARARELAVYPLGIKRGTHEAIRRAVQPLLTGTKTVIIDEGADPYELLVRTITAETPDPAAVLLALEGDYVSGGRRGAIRAEMVLDYVVSDEVTFAESTLRFSELTPDTVTAQNVTREDVT